MDEQIMSWATSRPEVSKDKITMWWVSVSLFIVNACVLCPSVSCSGCHMLVLSMYLFEQLDDPNFKCLWVF